MSSNPTNNNDIINGNNKRKRKRKKYQDITKTEEGRKRFKAAINTFRAMLDANSNANLSAFAESQQISRSQLYPYCRNDDQRIDYEYKGQKKKLTPDQVNEFCYKVLLVHPSLGRQLIISLLQTDFGMIRLLLVINVTEWCGLQSSL